MSQLLAIQQPQLIKYRQYIARSYLGEFESIITFANDREINYTVMPAEIPLTAAASTAHTTHSETPIQRNLIESNKTYAANFTQGDLALPPAKKYAVGT